MLNIAHRGFSSIYPENTMIAFEKACEIGCNGIEFDVHLSKDNEAVIIHDETLDRTTDGTGFVGSKTLSELQTYNAAKPRPKTAAYAAIPTLRQYFDYIVHYPHIITNIELKTGVFVYDGIEAIVYRLIKEFELADRIIISSFNHESIMRMKQLDPHIVCGLLVDAWLIHPEKYVQELGIECYHPAAYCLRPEMVAQLHRAGIRVHPWFGQIQTDYHAFIDMQADALITDYPDSIKQALQSRGQSTSPTQSMAYL